MVRRIGSKVRLLVASGLLLVVIGCTYQSNTPTTQPLTWDQKKQAAINDPMNYKIDDDTDGDISGGNINNLDKNAMKRDLDHVLSP